MIVVYNRSMKVPKLSIKFELTIPSEDGAPPRKFAVNRAMKARWNGDPQATCREVLEEIKNYRGSFVGDVMESLNSVVLSESRLSTEDDERSLDVTKWVGALVDSLLTSCVRDKIHLDLLQSQELQDWDGSFRAIDEVKKEDLKKIDHEKLMLLLAPKIKYLIGLMFRDIQK